MLVSRCSASLSISISSAANAADDVGNDDTDNDDDNGETRTKALHSSEANGTRAITATRDAYAYACAVARASV